MLATTLILFLSSLLMCSIALAIMKKSAIHFDFSADDMKEEIRKLTDTLLGWLVIGLLGQGGCLFFLSVVMPIVWVLE